MTYDRLLLISGIAALSALFACVNIGISEELGTSVDESSKESTHIDQWPDNIKWQITAISLATVTATLSAVESQKFNKLSDRNKTIVEKESSGLSPSESQQKKKEFEKNQEDMAAHKANVEMLDLITLVLLGWEVYLFMEAKESSSIEDVSRKTDSPYLAFYPQQEQVRFSLNWRW